MAVPTTGATELVRHAEEIVRLACRAPSQHNAQPWAFRVRPGRVEVYVDRTRLMPVTDPAERQLLVGVGAAVYGVRLALARLGVRPVTTLLPDPADRDLAALVTAAEPTPVGTEDARLAAQLELRRTVRGPFTDDPVPVPLQVDLADAVEAEGASLRWVVGAGERRALAALVTAAEHEQQADPAFRAELARWVGGHVAQHRAGVPSWALGPSAGAGHAAEFPMRDFTSGGPGGPDPARPEGNPTVLALVTETDDAGAWLCAGQALHRLLLLASAAGYAASYLNQPLEIRRLRARTREELRLDGHPQLLLRLGRPAGPLPPATPRRPLAEVFRR